MKPLMIKESEARQRAGDPTRVTWWRWRQQGLVPDPVCCINHRNYYCPDAVDRALLKLMGREPEAAEAGGDADHV